jgi:serine/threonine-protein kinase BUR1
MVSPPRKRHASRSPEDNRYVKRPFTSESPEEGELDDSVPLPLPISLPPKPPPSFKKVPFPFKKKTENYFVGKKQEMPVNVFGHKFVGCGLQSDYDVTTKLGEGTFGFVVVFLLKIYLKFTPCPCSEVHKAVQKSTGKVVALKRILMHNEKEGMPVTALREIKILKALKHVSIVNILDMFVVRSEFEHSFSLQ